MAAPALSIVELAESERTVLLRANIAEGGDADLSNLVLADIADYAAVGPEAVALSINRIWWSLENMNVELKFEADTPVKAVTLSGNGSYDFSAISGVKNPGGSGSTGSILLDTYGIAINSTLGCVGSLVIELYKVRSGEAGGDIDSEATSSLFTPEVPEVSGGIIVGGNSAAAGYIQFLEDSDNGSHYVQIQAPASLAGNVVLTLPGTDGDANQFLQTDGSGVLTWASVPDAVPFTAATTTVGSSISLVEGTDNGTNKIVIQAPDTLAADVTLTLPTTDGDASQFLQTNGSGVLTWASVNTDLSNDTTPQLGGDLDLNVHKLVTTSNGNIELAPDGTGNVVVTDCNLVVSSGYGIDFSATADGTTMGNELFDDYEEGTWTPSFYTTDGGSWGYNTRSGKYTKVGNLVYIWGKIITSSAASLGGGGLYVSGLPFSPVTSSEYHSIPCNTTSGWAANAPCVLVPYTADRLRPEYRDASDGDYLLNITTDTDGSTYLEFSGIYII